MTYLVISNREYFVNKEGLTKKEYKDLIKIFVETILSLSKPFLQKDRLNFVRGSIDNLERVVSEYFTADKPRIEEDNDGFFPPHNWLAYELNGKTIVIDPSYGYIGIPQFAEGGGFTYYMTKQPTFNY
ncbi:MAG: hypothetical protein Q8Q01_01680 [archaeon]|nr:hypothetical protein [archaeon]